MKKPEDDHREGICPVCNLTVASHVKERLPIFSVSGKIKGVAHRYCWDKAVPWLQARILEALGADPKTGWT